MISKLSKTFLNQVMKAPNKTQAIIASYATHDKAKLIMDLDQIKDSLLVDIMESAGVANMAVSSTMSPNTA